jgi:hypothetical protein
MVFFYGFVVEKKKKTITSITFFNGFVAQKWHHVPFLGFCYEGDHNNVITFLYGGGVVEKAMAKGGFFFFFFFFFFVVLLV